MVHIPKTSGSALEIAAAKAGVPWSFCHFRVRFLNQALPYPLPHKVFCPNDSSFSSNTSTQQQHEYYYRQMGGKTPWHIPPSFFRNTTDKHISNNSNNNTTIQFSFPGSFYDQSALFAVVRHPYDRMVSEFNYIHRRDLRDGGKLANASESDLRTGVNGWLQQRLTPYKEEGFLQTLHTDTQRTTTTAPLNWNGEGKSCATSRPFTQESTNHSLQVVPLGRSSRSRVPKKYMIDDGHFIPQSHFIFPLSLTLQNDTRTTNVTEPAVNKDTHLSQPAGTPCITTTTTHTIQTVRIHPTTKDPSHRLVHHVLYLEQLSEDLPRLMNAYNLTTITLTKPPTQKKNSKTQQDGPRLSASMLTTPTKLLIQQVYADDFAVFGYTP